MKADKIRKREIFQFHHRSSQTALISPREIASSTLFDRTNLQSLQLESVADRIYWKSSWFCRNLMMQKSFELINSYKFTRHYKKFKEIYKCMRSPGRTNCA